MFQNRKFLGEGLLIVFSVLFALFIDKMYDQYLTRQECKVALESVVQEINSNRLILKDWRTRHGQIKDRIDSIVLGDSPKIKQQIENAPFLDLGMLTDQRSLADSMLTATSWESAKSSAIISEFNFETTRLLTDVYDLQEIITGRTFTQIIDLYFAGSTHQSSKLDSTLIQFKLRFAELTSQEWMLDNLYQKASLYLQSSQDC